jgi:hypothetical protein
MATCMARVLSCEPATKRLTPPSPEPGVHV